MTLAQPGGTTSVNVPGVVVVRDAGTLLEASVGAFHNADEQSLPASGGALLTAGVAQIIDALLLANRQRQTGADNITALGVATGTQQLATPITGVTGNTTVSAGQGTLAAPRTVTLSAITGTNRGVTWNIGIGSVLVCEPGTARQEFAVVVSLGGGNVVNLVVGNSTTGAGFTHTANWALTTFAYNQARDASTPDGATGAGFAAGATYLLNNNLNGGAGGWEGERSAAGELDNASGTGTAIAAEYEFNGQGFDRGRNVQGKGATTGVTVNGNQVSGISAIPISGQASQANPANGAPIYLSPGTVRFEVVYAVASGATVSGGAVQIQGTTVNAHNNTDTVIWDLFAGLGPGLNGFSPTGIEIAEEALWSPAAGLYFQERAADADAMAINNLVAESIGVFNGSTFDRLRAGSGAAATGALKADAGTGTWASPTNVTSSVVAATLQAANASRRGLVISNDSTAKLYILFGPGTVSATNYTYVIGAGSTFESSPNPIPTTICTGVWSAANGSAGVTEIT